MHSGTYSCDVAFGESMYKYINAYADTLLQDSKLDRAVRDYCDLCRDFDVTDVANDTEYQRRFRRFWALNAARLNDQWIRRYFNLLQSHKGRSDASLESIVHALASAPTTPREALQFSFATKFLHMLDQTQPVYDSLIASFYFFSPPGPDRPFDRRLSRLLQFHQFLQSEYRRVIATGMLSAAAQQFRAAFPNAASLTDVKVTDFLIWTYVRCLRGGAQEHGRLLFD